MIGKYLKEVNKLSNIIRYQNITKIKENSVLEHEARVAKYCVVLARWEMHKFGNMVDMEELLLRAIHHDDLEAFTGDILSPTKRATKAVKEAIDDMEVVTFEEKMKPLLPRSFREDYERYMLYAKDDTIEGKILSAADIIDTIFECAEEVYAGNRNFERTLINVTEGLTRIDLQSARYFLKYSLRDIGLPLDAYGINVVRFIENTTFDDSVFDNPYLKKENNEK